jgi:hypothetical protein
MGLPDRLNPARQERQRILNGGIMAPVDAQKAD